VKRTKTETTTTTTTTDYTAEDVAELLLDALYEHGPGGNKTALVALGLAVQALTAELRTNREAHS
jgi:hypothetical protein